VITFERNANGFTQSGDVDFDFGLFQWLRADGTWDGGWTAEPVADLVARMQHSGPYKYSAYRILPAEMPPLDIKPTCAGCGVIAGEDCQRAGEYLFGRADVTESLPIKFNEDHQFSLSIRVATEGKHFGKKKPKQIWFNSVRCAELFLIANGDIKPAASTIGNGERLLAFIGGPEVVKARKKRAPNQSYLARLESADGLVGQHAGLSA
jgi:hypothetical protein